jgi:hypothetical protein
MKNPFTYSNIVTGPYFCNIKKEQDNLVDRFELVKLVKAKRNVG